MCAVQMEAGGPVVEYGHTARPRCIGGRRIAVTRVATCFEACSMGVAGCAVSVVSVSLDKGRRRKRAVGAVTMILGAMMAHFADIGGGSRGIGPLVVAEYPVDGIRRGGHARKDDSPNSGWSGDVLEYLFDVGGLRTMTPPTVFRGTPGTVLSTCVGAVMHEW